MLVFPLFWLMGLGRISAGVPVLHALYLDEFGHIKADDKPYGLFLGHVCILKQFQLVKATNKKIDRFSGHLPRTEKNRNRCVFYLFINGTLHLYNNNDHFELNYNTTLPEFENRMRHVVSRFRRRSLDVRTMTVIQGKLLNSFVPTMTEVKEKSRG
ncbi:uncharacterized protein LOC143256028 [Tachypleus tridentatus]|uniref:uncharacterized protein LOC143256028 n=1 Tax=Tachypleus tridentatus TaxID=6853 RepID=UPI003FD672A3